MINEIAFYLGIVLICGGIVAAAIWFQKGRMSLQNILVFFALIFLTGILFLVYSKIPNIDLEKLESLNRQAASEVEKISLLKAKVQSESDALALLVEQATKADRIAKELSDTNETASQQLEKISKTLKAVSSEFAGIREASEFNLMAAAAQNDDRKSFDQLKKWADDPSYPLSKRAGEIWRMILEKHHRLLAESDFEVTWEQGIDPMQLRIEQLSRIYRSAPAYLKPALIQYIWNRSDVVLKDRMAFLAKILEKDDDLTAVEFAGRYFAEAAGLNLKPLQTQEMLAWWQENEGKIEYKAREKEKTKKDKKKKK